jgi:hypothetical protein
MSEGPWTAKAVEYRVVEAAETLMLMPNSWGPQEYGNAMPAIRMEWGDYREPSRYIRRADRHAIDRMVETWGWVNALRNEADRKLLYAWAWVKGRKGRSVDDFALREGVNSRTLRRSITRICQRIADDLNQNNVVWPNARVDPVSENLAYEPTDSLPAARPGRSPSHFMAPGAKPFHLPDSPDTLALIEHLERQNRKREKA